MLLCDDMDPEPDVCMPGGIIEHKVEQVKREDGQIYDTISPWLREDAKALPPSTPWPLKASEPPPEAHEPNHGLSLRSLNPFALIRQGMHARKGPLADKRSFRRDKHHKRLASSQSPSRLPVESEAQPSRASMLFEPLHYVSSNESAISAGKTHGVTLDTNLDKMDDIIARPRTSEDMLRASPSTPRRSVTRMTPIIPHHESRRSESVSPRSEAVHSPSISPHGALFPGDLRAAPSIRSASPMFLPEAGPISTWKPPESWAVLSHAGEHHMKDVVGEYMDENEVAPSPTSHRLTDSDSSQIVIYEPVMEACSPAATMHMNPFDEMSEPRKPRFFRRAAPKEEDTEDACMPHVPSKKSALMSVGHAAFGRRHRSATASHFPFLRPRRTEATPPLDTPMLPQVPDPPAPLVFRSMDVDLSTGKTFVRVYMQNDTYVILSCAVETAASELAYALGRHAAIPDPQGHRLFLYERGTDRPLAPTERPARILRRRLIQAGYTEADGLDELGRQDLSFLLRFVYRADRASTVRITPHEHQDQTYKHMNLQGMHLTMIPVPVYSCAEWVVSLDLSMNPLTDVPIDFVQLCKNLRMLRIASLALKRVPESVTAIQQLTHLDVSSNRLLDLDHIPLHTLPALKVIRANNNRLSSVPAYMPDMSALQYLNLSNNRLDTFPMRICAIPNLRDLDLSFNAISIIPPDIHRLVHLERLFLVGNNINRLPAEMQNLHALRVLDVRHTSLHALGDLLSLPQLERLLASHNYLTHIEGDVGHQLQMLELSHNPLTRVHLAASVTTSLTHLNLSHANLVTINESLFQSVPQLHSLVLDHNQFASLPPLGALGQLEYLSCATNALAHLPESIGSLSALAHLDVRDNNLRTLPQSLWHCHSLQTLNASSNVLSALPIPESTDMPLARSLVCMSIADNRLSDDVFAVLMQFHELEILNVSMNELYEVPSGALVAMPQLQELYMSSNSLSALPADDLEHLQQLRVLFVNGNKLQSLPTELGRLKELRAIDAGNNALKYNIANWHYDWNWNANPELRYLNLSGNKRFEIKPKMADVHGREKNLADFNRLRHLRLLGLMEVTMTHQPLPDDSDHRRVRTTLAHLNAMPYGIADSIGFHDAFSVFDLVVPNFRGEENESLFGLIDGRSHSSLAGTRIARYVTDRAAHVLDEELRRLPSPPAINDPVPMAIRRAFLRLNQMYAEYVLRVHAEHTEPPHTGEMHGSQEVFWGWGSVTSPDMHLWQSGAMALLAYQRQHTLYVANIGQTVAVLSRAGGLVRVLGKQHDPLHRDETERIRAAEGWVSLRNYVNDKTPVARAFGHFHLTPVITACPSVHSIELTDADEFVIVANTELWKYLSYQMAVDIARMDHNKPRIASQKLRDMAIAYGAKEPIAVMVVTVAGLFHEHLNVHATQRATVDKTLMRRGRNDMDSTLARLEREVMPPIGQVALVFTDIKNSTLLWETNPSMQSAIRLHNLLLRRQMRSIGGYEVKTEGDAFMVSFPSVCAALLWCFSVQMRLLTIDWPQEILDSPTTQTVYADDGTLLYRGLSVRIGVHWGCPVCEIDPVNNRMDYFGPMVNRAARISAAADGGQILVSRDVIQELERVFEKYKDDEHLPHSAGSEAVSHSGTPRDVVFLRRLGLGIISMGQRRLKGIEAPEHLSIVYPKMLAGRYTHLAGARRSSGLFQMYEPTKELLALTQVKQLGYVCLRLESLSNARCFPGIDPRDPWSDAVYEGRHRPSQPVPSAQRSALVQSCVERAPEMLIIASREDATDAELFPILRQLVTRIRNSIHTITLQYAKRAPDTSQVLELLFRGLEE